MADPDYDGARARMVEAEAARGISDARVAAAMASVPREAFVGSGQAPNAYVEEALPIGSGQTISQPFVVAEMTQALELCGSERVLEIGTGSGYQAAVLRRIVPRVVTVERIEVLALEAVERFARLGIDGIEVHLGDGSLGWPPGAPYDAIVVTAAGPQVPAALIEQLAVGGRLVMPVGDRAAQRLVRVCRRSDGSLDTEALAGVRFVPLVGEQGWDG